MGKKTNWTTTEDQTLCRVWLTAGDLQLQGGDQKASNFWNVVRKLFHQEMEASVERPLNGLKVRWTRINKDSQKFAGIYNEIHSMQCKMEKKDIGESCDATIASLMEQQWIDEAKDAFYRYYNVKFTFEGCWKQLRYSSKWLQMFASSIHHPTLLINSLTASTMKEGTAQGPSSSSSEEEADANDDNVTITPAAPNSATISALPSCSNSASISSAGAAVAVAAISQASSHSSAFAIPLSHKHRADLSSDLCTSQQLQGLTVSLLEELKRQNDLIEDQNAIALLKVDSELLLDADAQHSYQSLRARYFKKSRTHHTYDNNARTNTLV
ncbi:uncharacterized protein PHALS_09009 [Plasmopara halstedii]|uniref:Uncharacterized protein n=1 Tax=Plasmopara halstedii TaxID=4781 RepID=A0A0P1AEM0_PLAHL|nr:uncharacterized protein PHALS_09009 [Plasmopara halstedii]CEG38967.1 hypothetical protein PHALS_09009 [Plasmopara halstedii]|eukprot:XP_024575336.1 hypothetical protein PHALS_09009 [Plasmopara halstedii]